MSVDIFSYPVLFLVPQSATGIPVAEGATGVLIRAGARCFLATNWHVVSGRNPETFVQNCEVRPEKLRISYRIPSLFSPIPQVAPADERLYDEDGRRRWVECQPEAGTNGAVDVVLLPLENVPNDIMAFGWERFYFNHFEVGEHVSIIGYPFGKYGFGPLPVWLTGTVASDLAGFLDRQFFYIDARTRPANSGSMVVQRTAGAFARKPGGRMGGSGCVTYFCGIYSGRIDKDSDIGIVWQWWLIERMLCQAIPAGERDWECAE